MREKPYHLYVDSREKTLLLHSLAGLETLKCEVKELTRDEAIIVMVESNLQHTTILPSEKAFAYKMRLEAMNRQGERTDLTSRPVGEKLFSVDKMSQDVSDSSRQIHRYIRLTERVPESYTDTERYGIKKLSPLLSEMQAGKFD